MTRQSLEAARHELLDLGLRNPLLNYRTLRGLDVVDEVPAEVYRTLVAQGRAMSFLPAADVGWGEAAPPEPEEPAPQGSEEAGPAARHTDARLQTPYPPDPLQARLLATFYAARTFIEEQGSNVLYLALGMLEWYADATSEQVRRAPLLLVPVALTRTDVRARFRLAHTGEDVGGNLTLQAKLRADFGLQYPLPDPEADLDVDTYFEALDHVVAGMPRWRVDRQAVHLGFFLFGKLLMYNDLDVEAWPEEASPLDHEVVGALLGTGFAPATGRLTPADHLDAHLDPREVHQVVDADSSQALALLDVKRGHPLVIQGPPGTGKSQTITNVIAEALGAGQTVLFVAEKMAALDVVKRRLDAAHLGDACLELHSNKASKKEVLAELQRTLALGEPTSPALAADPAVLVDARDQLNRYAHALNAPVGATGVSPYEAQGRLLQTRGRWADVDPPLGPDPAVEAWTAADAERRRARVADVQALVGRIGRPLDHPFWGSRRRAFYTSDEALVEQTARAALGATAALGARARALGDALGLPAHTPSDAAALAQAARRALSAPDLRGIRVGAEAWADRHAEVDALLGAGEAYATVRAAHEGALIQEAWTADLLGTRQHLAAHGPKWYRAFVGDWRRAKATLAGLASAPLPAGHAERLALADAVLEAQRLKAELDRAAALGARLFGGQWRGEGSDWPALRRVTGWVTGLHRDVRAGAAPPEVVAFLASGPDLAALAPLVASAEAALAAYGPALAAAVEAVDFHPSGRFGEGVTLADVPLADLHTLLDTWATVAPLLREVAQYNALSDALLDDELALFAGLAAEWAHAPTHLADAFDHAWYAAVLHAAQVARPALGAFDGATHREALRRFVSRDRLALDHNQARLALRHWQGLPRHGENGTAAGQLGVLRREFSKKARHKPVRRLMAEAGRAVQAIKPVFMMSPLSVAAYLPPGALEFDLVVFDEASQVKPVDAFGALLRGRQAVVVGDSKQLPPTSFFDALTGEAADEDEDGETQDVESVLELFEAKQAPERMLSWHYRSRHESLIAVSNREFYDGRLVVFPSPDAERAGAGLALRHLPEARYGRGGTRANPAEAWAVAEAVMAHARVTPHLTLLVATFSQAQQQAVWAGLEALRRASPEAEPFFADDRPEPFEVKNLENVQGDERDVVFISVGYGRDERGVVSMNFGPLNREGGERRLNVLITRARLRCEVFTNLRADDLDLARTAARGVAAFKRFLHYAETGVLDVDAPTGRGPDSPFEQAVADALRAAGHRIAHQVGVGGYRIDLAVVDPERPGRYLLGVECDGASYHSARTARDRDRIRQSVLEGLGWRFHRVWSTDWFRAPEPELERVLAAVARARTEASEKASARAEPSPPPPPPHPSPGVQRAGSPGERVRTPPAAPTRPYQLAEVSPLRGPLAEASRWHLAAALVDVVRVESPVHFDEATRRILDASGVRRLGSRIREAFASAAAWASAEGQVVRRGDFLYLPSQHARDIVPRERSALPAASRQMDRIAPEEVQAAIREAVRLSLGIAPEDLPPAVGRMLGFGQTTAAVRAAVEHELAELLTDGAIAERSGVLVLTPLAADAG